MDRTTFMGIIGVLLLLLLAGCATPQGGLPGDGPFEVRALSEEEVEDLRTGAGMGLAGAAEHNGYPGPLHALALVEPLGLSEAQVEQLMELREAMLADAIPLGDAILDAHGRIEERFRLGGMDEETLRAEITGLEGLYADLRYVHLRTHLAAYDVFTSEQVREYMRLRGHLAEESHEDGAHGH